MLHFSFTDLMVFSAVADKHNLTKGAAKVHLAPSSASVRIKNLEDALGLPLLNRQARGVELTKAGEIVDGYAKRAISLMGEMQQSLQPYLSQKAGFIRIAANYGAGIAVVSNEAFAQAVPEGDIKAVAIEQDWAKRELRIAINEKFESTCSEMVQHLLQQLATGQP